VGISGIARDITERKRAEEAMRESEERLRLAAQAGKMYAFEWDVATDVVVRSSEYVNVLGRSEPRTLTHQQAMEKVHPDDREKLVAAVDRHSLENPTVDVTYRVLLPGKSPIWVKSSGRAFFDGEGRMLRVIGMVADVTDQKLAEEALRSSEERLRLAQKAARIGTFERNIRTGVNTWTPEMESMYGLPPGGFGQTRTAFENLVHPDDRAEVMKLVDEALKTGQPTHGEWRVVWPDESVHWIAGRWQVLMEESGEPSRVVGVDMDITERKLAEAALANVSRKLIEAQEHERTRIGRELHDDIGQRLAMLAIGLEQLQQESPALPAEVRSQMGELKKQTFEIAADIQSLSHELHSAKLQYLGIAAAMRGFCQEFGEQQKVEVDFQTHDLPSPVSPDTALCFFRVLQEALHNSAKHSGVRHFEVRLWGASDEIHLTVSDPGVSFDREAAKQSRGLGLISMEERLKLVNGTLSIESQPRRGTTIHARVPLRSGSDYLHATG
jgi:PAS domain S-box-containing protein